MKSLFRQVRLSRPQRTSPRNVSSEGSNEAARPANAEAPLSGVPDTFKWGSADCSFQSFKGLNNCDWHQWQNQKGLFGMPRVANGDKADDGPEFAFLKPDGTPGGHFVDDLKALKEMGHNTYRFSLEWSLLQPTPDAESNGKSVEEKYDPNAVRLYRAILAECRKNGLTPMVTLQHFTLPIWVNNLDAPEKGLGGWAGEPGVTPGEAPIVKAFATFAGDMAELFGGEVDHWITLNEPNLLAIGSYVASAQPGPGKFDPEGMRRAFVNMAHAHARAYDAIKERDTKDADGDGVYAQVGIAQHVRRFEPKNPNSAADREAAAQYTYICNALLLDAMTSGNVDWNGDGKFDGPDEGMSVEGLKNKADFVGLNYYSTDEIDGMPSLRELVDKLPIRLPNFVREKVSALPISLPMGPFRLRGIPWSTILPMIPWVGHLFRAPNTSDLGWKIDPDGLYQSLKWADDRYHLPIYITENGIADAKDTMRPDFIVDHIEAMQRAMNEGVDVRGYYHWAPADNFEWGFGYGARFGLRHVDFSDPNKPRTERFGSKVYSKIIDAGGVTPEVRAFAAAGNAAEI